MWKRKKKTIFVHFYLCSSVILRQVFTAGFFISFAWTLVSPCILLSGFLKACVGAGWFVESMWCRITCWLYNTTMDYTSRIELYFSQFFLFFRHSRFHGLDTVFVRSFDNNNKSPLIVRRCIGILSRLLTKVFRFPRVAFLHPAMMHFCTQPW